MYQNQLVNRIHHWKCMWSQSTGCLENEEEMKGVSCIYWWDIHYSMHRRDTDKVERSDGDVSQKAELQ